MHKRGRVLNERGVTLIELLSAVFAASIVIIGIGSFYARMQDSYNQDNVQSVMQRQGTLVQDEMSRVLLASSALLAGTCGPSTTAGDSIPAQVPAGILPEAALSGGGFVCFFLDNSQIVQCRFTSAATRGCISGTSRNLLAQVPVPVTVLGGRQTDPPTNLVSGTTFDVFTLIGGSAVEVRFRLATRSLTDPLVGPLDFTTRVTVRNG